jgi:hypothetical protein
MSVIHPPASGELRAISATTIIKGLARALHPVPYPRFPSMVADLLTSGNAQITLSIAVLGPHRIRGFNYRESVGPPGGNFVTVLLSGDRLTDANAPLRDQVLFGDLSAGSWLPFTTTPQSLEFNHLVTRWFTQYKFCHRNNSGVTANVNATLLLEI